MRILLLTNIFPSPLHPHKGTFNLEMVRGLATTNDVRVICPLAWTEAIRRPSRAVAHDIIAGIRAYYPRFYYPPRMLRRYYGPLMWYSVKSTVDRVLADDPVDLVMGYWAHPDGAVAVMVARREGVPSAVMVGGSDVLLFTRSRVRRRLIADVLQGADAVITVGEDLKEVVVGLDIDRHKVHVVRRGVDTSRFNPGSRSSARDRLGIPQEMPALLWIGRMVPVKGLDVLLRAAARMKSRGVRFRLDLVGDGPLKSSLERQALKLGLGAAVAFRGACAHAETPDWFRAADVTVLPSYSEGVPNVLLESLACGTRFVASAVGGTAGLAEAGLDALVPAGDEEALAQALEASLTAPVRVRRTTPVLSASLSTAKLVSVLDGACRRSVACA